MHVYFGLIGKSIQHSRSPMLFKQRAYLLNQIASYVLCPLERITDFEALKNDIRFVGFNVTAPYKKAILSYVERCSWIVQRTQSANTLVRLYPYKPVFAAYNTDLYGLWYSVRLLLGNQVPERVLILGTGGAARTAYFLFHHYYKTNVWMVSRTPKGIAQSYAWANRHLHTFKLIINATPLGGVNFEDQAPALDYDALHKGQYFLDLIYYPEETLFLRYGKARGCKVLNGMPMLVAQAERSWMLWRKEITRFAKKVLHRS